MQELTTTGALVERGVLDGENALTLTLERDELEALLGGDGSPKLWLELGREGDEETSRLTVELTPDDLERMLHGTEGDVELTLAASEVEGLLEDAEVEAHGLRKPLAIVIASAAVAITAPSAFGATPQTSQQLAPQVGAAAVTQQVGAAATTQQVSSQVTRAALKGQVAQGAAKGQISRGLGLKLLRAGLLR